MAKKETDFESLFLPGKPRKNSHIGDEHRPFFLVNASPFWMVIEYLLAFAFWRGTSKSHLPVETPLPKQRVLPGDPIKGPVKQPFAGDLSIKSINKHDLTIRNSDLPITWFNHESWNLTNERGKIRYTGLSKNGRNKQFISIYDHFGGKLMMHHQA